MLDENTEFQPFFMLDEFLMQEHLSMTASQLANHINAHTFRAEREAQPHLN
jgi:hypothetical protein